MDIYFLDVGQGDCTFIVPPAGEGAPVLFDCADLYTAERFVANHGISDLSAVVASHLDWDHIRGMLPFLKNHFRSGHRVEQLVLTTDRVTRADANLGLKELVRAALDWEVHPPHDGFVLLPNHRTLREPVTLAHGADWSIELVLPFLGTANHAVAEDIANGASAVLRVRRAGTTVLIGGDALLMSWERLDPPTAKVIRTSHHGGEIRIGGQRWTTFAHLYDAVGADLAVVSAGTNNPHGHPYPEHLVASRRGGACRALCTQLTPQCDPNPLALRNEALRVAAGVEYPYRHRSQPGHPRTSRTNEVPCAGTVVASIAADGSLSVLPEPGGVHDSFVIRVASPRCR